VTVAESLQRGGMKVKSNCGFQIKCEIDGKCLINRVPVNMDSSFRVRDFSGLVQIPSYKIPTLVALAHSLQVNRGVLRRPPRLAGWTETTSLTWQLRDLAWDHFPTTMGVSARTGSEVPA
jgi:hypothetical protein